MLGMSKHRDNGKKNNKKSPTNGKLNGKGKIPAELLRKSENSSSINLEEIPQFNLIIAEQFADMMNENQKKFLKAYCRCGVIAHAAKIAKINYRTHWNWQYKDAEYKRRFEEAQAIHTDWLEFTLFDRAVAGEDNTCLIFALKGAKPYKYSERYQVSGPGGRPVQVEHDHEHRHELGYKSRSELLTMLAAELNKTRAAEIEEQKQIEHKEGTDGDA